MYGTVKDQLRAELDEIEAAGLTKRERGIRGPQSSEIEVAGREVLNFCANNYLGLANDPRIVAAAHRGLDEWGYGLASVRFICGTQELHLELERRVSEFLGYDDTILFSSCFDANGGVFEVLFGPDDAIISDELNHASIIDGIRLSKAQRYRYRNRDLADLEAQLVAASDARRRVIVTDGVFSMDGYIAPLPRSATSPTATTRSSSSTTRTPSGSSASTAAAPPSTAVSRAGSTSRPARSARRSAGHPAATWPPARRSSTCCASGPVPTSSRTRSRRRSSSGTLQALELLEQSGELRVTLRRNAALFRSLMEAEGFDLLPGEHPIVPVMFGDAALTARIADALQARGVYVTAFSFPVVPRGAARIRVQLSAAHTEDEIRRCVAAFAAARDEVAAAAPA